MLRVYLPFIDVDGSFVRWSQYVDVEENSASLSWFEATRHLVAEHPGIDDLVSCMGQPDESTAQALRDVIGDLQMRRLRRVGYGEVPTAPSVRVHGEDYLEADLVPADIAAERRIPEFAWDADRRLAWGSRLYPDSLIIAAELSSFRRLRNDPRLDSSSIRVERDQLPPISGD
ncbi:hypothetical protein HDC37_003153 [Microbacterium sp. AK009]|uniref:hypothetical protein n=1 Tax=Microbacterium sp. AK009 TaxID=2723068 RepID=UPI0015CB48FF|nr:hypothetical protein [Microbacterium sp. AK009]NYF18297.1 hypothetical protein [Microbacterium sp. AK009]